MSFRVGRKGASHSYPSAGGAAGAAVAALRNRNVAVVPQVLSTASAPFAPGTGTNVAAILFTPKVSGVVQITAMLGLLNGATPDTYAATAAIDTGTGLSVTAGSGSITSNGWIMGATAPVDPPVVGGAISSTSLLGTAGAALVGAENGSIVISAISQPLFVGVPVVIRIELGTIGGQSLNALDVTSLSVMELP